ncbi:hypothetical protein [Arthrobacter bambusae]|uniref:Uncharacterized protein n=1 Tax=Arthrobacter bambusae TaxID=1338426 RepID=A0AAW8DE12_9MICC|nr:hypothetical protein [Arthrobacter bambusae]MDP9904753.1 hypothetical protein [Arthrobacter bambusae]MDQ0129569.1 hypothetical protein [Arthrobacter bambusae]MDQ0180818.1 hypothetical protein [Arthrobacter bambusae]
MTRETSIPELAAEVIIDAHAINRRDDETALQAFAWALGPDIDYEQGLREFADAIQGQLTAVARLLDREAAIDLIKAKIELLFEYKLERPQDYTADDIAEMRAEIARLGELRDRLAVSPVTA